jgi:hypothetical protein
MKPKLSFILLFLFVSTYLTSYSYSESKYLSPSKNKSFSYAITSVTSYHWNKSNPNKTIKPIKNTKALTKPGQMLTAHSGTGFSALVLSGNNITFHYHFEKLLFTSNQTSSLLNGRLVTKGLNSFVLFRSTISGAESAQIHVYIKSKLISIYNFVKIK